MRNKFLYIITSLVIVIAAMSSCDDKQGRLVNDKDVAPQPIETYMIKTVTGVHGGAYIVFNELPQESNFLYVEATYKVDAGTTITKAMSVYSDTLFINGLGKRQNDFGQYEYEVSLRSVSRGGSKSEPCVITVNPLEPNISIVNRTISIRNSFASVIISGVNELQENVDVCVILATDPDYENKVTRVSSFKDSTIYFTIPNLEEKEYYLATYTKDSYNNYSDTTYIMDPIVPLADRFLEAGWGEDDTYSFTWLNDAKLYGNKWESDSMLPLPEYRSTIYTKDSMKNAAEAYSGGKITNFWDGVYEDGTTLTNFFGTGNRTYNKVTGYWAYPYSYFIDLGRTVRLSRFTIWQRNHLAANSDDAAATPYAGTNTKTFELWGRPVLPGDVDDVEQEGSDRLSGWFKIGTYTIITPSSTELQASEALAGHSFAIFDSEEPMFSEPLRYLRFKGIEGFGFNADDEEAYPGSPYIGTMSEIYLYGKNEE